MKTEIIAEIERKHFRSKENGVKKRRCHKANERADRRSFTGGKSLLPVKPGDYEQLGV